MKIIYNRNVKKELIPKIISHLLDDKFTEFSITYESVDYFKLRAERMMTHEEIQRAGTGFLLQRRKGLPDGSEAQGG